MRVQAERAALRDDAACLLGELGGTAREVALSLHAFGLPSPASSSGRCIIASYIYVVVSADTRVKRVRLSSRWLVLKPHQWWSPSIWLRLPRPYKGVHRLGGPGRARAPGQVPVPRRLSANKEAQMRHRQPGHPTPGQDWPSCGAVRRKRPWPR
jgi:hypothetical protein